MLEYELCFVLAACHCPGVREGEGGRGEVQLKVGQRRVTAPHATRVTAAAAGALLGRNHEAVRSKFKVVKFSILRLTLLSEAG